MENTINEIMMITLAESPFCVEYMRPHGTWHAELRGDSIVTYYVTYGSKKKTKKNTVSVPQEEMQSLFKEVYTLVRTAKEWGQPIDDTAHTITLYYNRCHKEIIEGDAEIDGKWLISILHGFLEAHGNYYWPSE